MGSRGGRHGRRGGRAVGAGDGGARRNARGLRALRDVPAARGVRPAGDLAAACDRSRFHAGRTDRADGRAARDSRRSGRPGALRRARRGAVAGDGPVVVRGRCAPAGVRGGFLRQARATRLHQRRGADRNRVPAGQAARDQRRCQGLLRDRLGGALRARQGERTDSASERRTARGGDCGRALGSCGAGLARDPRARARARGGRELGRAWDRGCRRGPGRAAGIRTSTRRCPGLPGSHAACTGVLARRLRRSDRDRADVRAQARLRG